MKKKVFVALSSFAEHGQAPVELLKKSGFEFVLNTSGKRLEPKETVAMAVGADGIIAGLEVYDCAVLEGLPRLKCISRCGVGTDNIDLAAAQIKGITVVNTPDVVVQPVAELTVGFVFNLLRSLTRHTEDMRRGGWVRHSGYLLSGKTVGVLGLGRIGRRVAELFKRLDAQVIGYDFQPDRAWADKAGVAVVSKEALLSRSDVLCVHVACADGAPAVVGAGELISMKKGAFLVNVSRGQAVDETALLGALKNNHLAGAALDVFAQEPYNGPLSQLPNVLLTPHVGSLTHESRVQMETEAVENLLKVLSGSSVVKK